MSDEPVNADGGQDVDRRRLLQALGAGGTVIVAGCLSGGGGGNDTTEANDGGGSGGDTTEASGGGDTTEASGGDGTTGGDATTSGGGTASGDGGTIQFLTMGVGENIEQFFKDNNKKFEEEHNANLEFTSVAWDSAQQTVNNRVDGGKAPDVARWPARWIPQLAGKDAIVSMDDMMTGEFGEQFYDGMVEGCTYEGTHYAAPWASSNKCMYYNKSVFESAGLDPENPSLDSWEEMLSAAKTIKQEADTPALGLAGADAIETGSQYYHYHWSYGADLVNDDGKPVVNSDAGVEALSFYSGLSNEHGVTQNSPLSSTRQDIRQLFESGDLGMVLAHVYTGINIDDSDADFDYGIVQVPKGPEGRYSLNTIDGVSIFAQSENKDLARDLLRFYLQGDRHFQYAKNKGFLPTIESVGERDYFQDSKNWKPFVKAAEYARARPKLTNFNEFNSRMVQAIQEALGGQKSPQKALDDAQGDLEGMVN